MLIRFTVENFLSFKDEVEFSMVAGRTRKHKDHIFSDDRRKDLRLLKTGVIWGANASGKTNLIKAIDFAQNLIVSGRRANQGISAVPFLLDSATTSQSSKFTFEIKSDERLFHYSFEVDATAVRSEILRELRPSSEKILFDRKTNSVGQTDVTFGKLNLTEDQSQEFLEFTARGTRPNQLFLYESVDRNISYFRDVYDWFQSRLVLIYPRSIPGAEIGVRYANNADSFREKYHDMIQQFDLDIEDIDLQKVEVDIDGLFNEQDKLNISQYLSELPDDPNATAVFYNPRLKLFVFVDKSNQFNSYQFFTVHKVRHENRVVNFELFMESDGTLRLFELTPAWIRLISSSDELVFVVDELDRRLHAQMTVKLLEIFLENSVGKPIQLIVTTHETGLLDLDLLRRDEIWFVEKDSHSASQVYSLEEFAPRYDVEVQRGYLGGRYGAIPILPSYDILDWAK